MTFQRKRPMLLGLLAIVGLLGIVVVRGTLGSAALMLSAISPISTGQPHREISGDPKSPAISFIESPSPTCYRPAMSTGACYIQWDHLYVTTDPARYIISMTVTIDNQIRAYHSGFFQSSMYIPGDLTAPGYRVTCGMPESSTDPVWGHVYSYTLDARDTAGLKASNTGSVSCPADTATAFVPVIGR